jgi:hypothetical protein
MAKPAMAYQNGANIRGAAFRRRVDAEGTWQLVTAHSPPYMSLREGAGRNETRSLVMTR